MRDTAELTYLYHGNPLLTEIAERDNTIAWLRRQLAAADERNFKLRRALVTTKTNIPRNRRDRTREAA